MRTGQNFPQDDAKLGGESSRIPGRAVLKKCERTVDVVPTWGNAWEKPQATTKIKKQNGIKKAAKKHGSKDQWMKVPKPKPQGGKFSHGTGITRQRGVLDRMPEETRKGTFRRQV